jgi:ubiquinone/menaquinone biosynthesis C-methylase UbiE
MLQRLLIFTHISQCEQADVWKLDPAIAQEADKALRQISRVLKPGGKFIYITYNIAFSFAVLANAARGKILMRRSFGQPHFRKPILNKPEYGWDLQTETIGAIYFRSSFASRIGLFA